MSDTHKRTPVKWWRRAPKWFRRIRNRRLRHIQTRETHQRGEVATPFRRDAGYIYW